MSDLMCYHVRVSNFNYERGSVMNDKKYQAARLLTYVEAGELLSCSAKTVGRMIQAGKLPRVYLAPQSPRVPLEAILELVKTASFEEVSS